MKKITLIFLITLILCFINGEAVFSKGLAGTYYIPASLASEEEYLDILQVALSFNVYTEFFKETTIIDGELLSANANSISDGLAFLSKGFSEDLAFNIINYHTYQNDSAQLAIIAKEAIPIFTTANLPYTNFCHEKDRITLKVNYYDCYSLGDSYLYYITAYKDENRYIINDLQWEKVNP